MKNNTPHVYVLHIRHQLGDDTSVYSSHEHANDALVSYCKEYWDHSGLTLPQNGDDIITGYFEENPEENGTITPSPILGDAGLVQLTAEHLKSLRSLAEWAQTSDSILEHESDVLDYIIAAADSQS